MSIFLLPEFIADLQSHNDAHFARRVLQKTLRSDGTFQPDSADHRYKNIDNAWIRRISRGHTAYRVIYLRYGEKVYLYRAGEHYIESHLVSPRAVSVNSAIPVSDGKEKHDNHLAISQTQKVDFTINTEQVNRFRRNVPKRQIYKEIFSRRNLPHKDIWLIAPFINEDLFQPTGVFGKLLLHQVEDGASVVVITAAQETRTLAGWKNLMNKASVFSFIRVFMQNFIVFYSMRIGETRLE